MMLNLVGSGPDLSIAKEIQKELGVEVGDTNEPGKLILHELLHFGPGLVDRGSVGCSGILARAALVLKVGRVFGLGVDILQGDGEVNEIQVKIVQA